MINLTIKTDLTDDTIKEAKSPGIFVFENPKNTLISIVGTFIFAVLTILFPLFRVFGGFLTYSDFNELFGSVERVFYWDQVISIGYRGQIYNNNYVEFSRFEPSTALIWQIIHLWGLIWILFGLIGAVLVMLPAFQVLQEQKPVNVAKIGFVLGLVATGVEFGLFILAWVFSNSTRGFSLSNARNLYINFLLLDCFVIGWIGILVGYVFTTKE
jgi:hypothetical protein